MFEFIGNTVRDLALDWEWSRNERSFKKAEKDFDKWNEDYQEKCRVIDALDSGSSAARAWCVKNHDLPKAVDEYISGLGFHGDGYYRKAFSGMMSALAACRSIILCDEEGFGTWERGLRMLETSIRFFFGKDKYENYDDISDSEVPALKNFTNFDNPYDVWICNEILEEAFRRVQGNDPQMDIEIDIATDYIKMIPKELPPRIEVVGGQDSQTVDHTTPEATAQAIKDDPNIIDAVIIDGKATPIFMETEAEKMHTVQFYKDDDEEPDFVSVAVEVDKAVYEEVEAFITKMGFSSKRRMYPAPDHNGLYELAFKNGQSIYIDPGIVAGTGVNFVGTAWMPSSGRTVARAGLVSLDKDPEIARKMLENPGYALTPEEYQKVSSHIYGNGNIYTFIDFSGMKDHMESMNDEDKIKFGKKLTAIVNLMINSSETCVRPLRFRFYRFESIDSFTLVSDAKAKAPLPFMMKEKAPWAFVVNGDKFDYCWVQDKDHIGSIVIESYDITYGA